MTKIYQILIGILLLGSCSESVITTEQPDWTTEGVIVRFDISEAVQVKSGRGVTGDVGSLYMLVFDENGLYQSKHEGELMTQNQSTANYRFRDIPLTGKDQRRVLHFIANYDWSSFSDASNIGKS
ncbi:MAG: hypothetical protein ACRCX4_12435, partial [Bacteroidales bacterium]